MYYILLRIDMEGILKKKVSILRGFEDKWFKLTEDGFLEYYEVSNEE